MEIIFDIGMFDGKDTAYYLESGYKVIAVEANPELFGKAMKNFEAQVASGQLICINAAITPNGEAVDFVLSETDLGSSTIFAERIANKRPSATMKVKGITIGNLINRYGIPDYMKVDIEGADRFCVLSLKSENKPKYLSFEVGEDVHELLSHAASIGYKRFKIINQNTFREFANIECFRDRIARRIVRYMGYADPLLVRRSGRFFSIGHSSGPLPWISDGKWRSFEKMKFIIEDCQLPGWNDIHASAD